MDTIDWRNGRVQGAVYDHDAELIEISAKAYEMFMWSNPLHADVFKVVLHFKEIGDHNLRRLFCHH